MPNKRPRSGRKPPLRGALGVLLSLAAMIALVAEGRTADELLCELEIAAAQAELPVALETIATELAGRCLFLVKQREAGKERGAASNLRVNGLDPQGVDLADPQWRSQLDRALADARADPGWSLDPYLAKTAARDGRPTVDFTLCNMERVRPFKGSFRLLLAERHALPLGRGQYWRVRNEVAREPIARLAPAATVGCALPERFALPSDRLFLSTAIIAVVYDAIGHVQALLYETLTPEVAHP